MAKEVKAKLKLQIPGGGATPAPPVGSALGQYGVNIMDFVQAFNNDTSSRQGETVPVEITIFEDNSFTFVTKTAPASYLIKKAIGLESGSPEPHKEKVASITRGKITRYFNFFIYLRFKLFSESFISFSSYLA